MIKNKEINTRLAVKYENVKNLIQHPAIPENVFLNDIIEGSLLDTITAQYSGKVLYIDLWAPWCGPCMAEMPYAKILKEKYRGKEIKFIYLACQTDEDIWRATIAEQKINGEHFLLTKKQYGYLAKKFNMPGIPFFLLVDKSGKVIPNAPPPSNIEEVSELINSML